MNVYFLLNSATKSSESIELTNSVLQNKKRTVGDWTTLVEMNNIQNTFVLLLALVIPNKFYIIFASLL